MFNYAKNECIPIMEKMAKRNLEAEKYLQKEFGIERYPQYSQPKNSNKYDGESNVIKILQNFGINPKDLSK